jgi:membrane fusion protein (multidrug efflux system)
MATALKEDVEQIEPRGAAAPPAKSGKRRIVLPIVILLAALGAIWAFKQWSYGRAHESTDDAAIDGHFVPVLAKVTGYVQLVTVGDNDHVKSDSLLVQIDPSEYRVRVAQAEPDLAAARATAGGVGTDRRRRWSSRRRTACITRAQIDAARANEVRARQDLGRMEELAAKAVISVQLDGARAAAEAAAANVVALQRRSAASGST